MNKCPHCKEYKSCSIRDDETIICKRYDPIEKCKTCKYKNLICLNKISNYFGYAVSGDDECENWSRV